MQYELLFEVNFKKLLNTQGATKIVGVKPFLIRVWMVNRKLGIRVFELTVFA